jgi:transposase-like protein
MKYTIKQFNQQFPDDKACLEFIFKRRYPNGATCKNCKRSNCFYAVTGRRSYACSWCAFQIYPTAGSIFHKSRTSLKFWMFAIFLASQSKNGVSAKELERALGVTYKTAFRMAHKIKSLMTQGPSMLSGTVEVDETWVGGENTRQGRGSARKNKSIIVGAVQRKGDVRAIVIDDTKGSTVVPLVRSQVRVGSTVITDEAQYYKRLPRFGYKHDSVHHRSREYVRGDVYTNTIEGFWSQMKRSINGTYHAVSPKYLQQYVNEFAYRYNCRNSSVSVFELLMRQMAV